MKVDTAARLLERIIQAQMPVENAEFDLLLGVVIRSAQDTWDDYAPRAARIESAEFLRSKDFSNICLTIGIEPEWMLKKIKQYEQVYRAHAQDTQSTRPMRYRMSKAKPRPFTVIFGSTGPVKMTFLYTTVAPNPPQAVDNAWRIHAKIESPSTNLSFLEQKEVSVLYVFNGRLRNRYRGHGRYVEKQV